MNDTRVRTLSLRQRHGEYRPPPRPALHLDAPAMRLGDPLADGEPQPRPRPLAGAGARGIGTVEPVEDVRYVARRDADPCIGDGEGDAAVLVSQAYTHPAAARRVLHRVREQIEQQLAHAAAVHVE